MAFISSHLLTCSLTHTLSFQALADAPSLLTLDPLDNASVRSHPLVNELHKLKGRTAEGAQSVTKRGGARGSEMTLDNTLRDVMRMVQPEVSELGSYWRETAVLAGVFSEVSAA